MMIVQKNEGTKIPYEVNGTKITFDDDLTINLKKRQADWDVHIDVCSDADNCLVIGTAAGRAFVAEIDIPARQYTETEDGESVAQPLDMDAVALSLWAIDE